MKNYTMSHIGSMRVIHDIHMTETIEDWSRVRSPGRARRRRKLGHRQNIVWREVPKKDGYRVGDMLVMHPETAKELEAMIAKQMEETLLHGESLGRTTVDANGSLTMEHLTKWRL